MMVWTLEMLETSDNLTARIWRLLLDKKMTVYEVADALHVTWPTARGRMQILRKARWLNQTQEASSSRPAIWSSSKEGRFPGQSIRAVRQKMTDLAKSAHRARYTGLASAMGRALAEIEKEIIQIRDQLTVR